MIQDLEHAGEKIEKEEIEGPGGVKGVYGFSVKTLGGKPFIDTFGNVKVTPKGTIVDNVREPLVDILMRMITSLLLPRCLDWKKRISISKSLVMSFN